MSSTTAPRTPETDKQYECLNSTNSNTKLELDIANNNLHQKTMAYDAALATKADAESETEQKRSKVVEVETDLNFLKIQLENARGRVTDLGTKFESALNKVNACNSDESCTVAEKQILVLTSNNASTVMLENDQDIKQYLLDIEDKETEYQTINDAFIILEEGSQRDIEAAMEAVEATQIEYNAANVKQKLANQQFIDLHDDCKIEAFHENQSKLDVLRDDLSQYGITIEYEQFEFIKSDITIPGETQGGSSEPTEPSFQQNPWDCRYRQIAQCQGDNIDTMTDQQRSSCRQKIDPVCFENTYETFWLLDVISFFLIAPAIPICIFEENFSYGLCVASSAYIMTLKSLQDHLGIHY